jgi:putative FmdB family regulatory protein
VPIYEYLCQKCGHKFEKIQKFSDRLIKKCPECGGPVEQTITAPAVQFKGTGWYVTDYANKDGRDKSSSSPRESSAGSEKDDSAGSAKEKGDTKDTKDSKDLKESSREAKESRDSNESKRSKESKESKATKPGSKKR